MFTLSQGNLEAMSPITKTHKVTQILPTMPTMVDTLKALYREVESQGLSSDNRACEVLQQGLDLVDVVVIAVDTMEFENTMAINNIDDDRIMDMCGSITVAILDVLLIKRG